MSVDMTSLRGYMEGMVRMRQLSGMNRPDGFKYICMEEFVLKEGAEHKNLEFDPEVYSGAGRTKKMCFMNAVNLATSTEGLAYAEGYAFSIIPTMHAWCVTESGEVVDPTWDYADTNQYYGVSFDPEWALQKMTEKGTYGLIDDWENQWPLLRGEPYKKPTW